MKVIKTKIPGCYEIFPIVHRDERGSFVKTFHKENFQKHNLVTDFTEEYYSISKQGVLRGLHFQTPSKEHTKMVYCTSGSVMDVVVDLRVGSPTYGQFEQFELNSKTAQMIYVPAGLAHGFYVVSEEATLVYSVTSVYSPAHDSGLLWNSVGIPWPSQNPITSPRDQAFQSFKDFKSPFIYV